MTSLRKLLLTSLLGILLIVSTLSGMAVYWNAKQEINELFDSHMHEIASLYNRQATLITASEPYKKNINKDFGIEEGDRILSQIWSANNELLYSSYPATPLPIAANEGFSFAYVKKQKWRIFQIREANHIIQVAQPREIRKEVVTEVALRIITPMLGIIPLLGLLIWVAVGKGLQPLKRIAEAVQQRTPSDMSPINSSHTPLEIQPLIVAINDLLQRLAGAMQLQRQFIADAAHELRTPLTAIQLQAELVENASSPQEHNTALSKLNAGIRRCSHLVQQLLQMAKFERYSLEHTMETVDLVALAKEVIEQYLPLADNKSIVLGLSAQEEEVAVWGEKEGLRTLISNILDNAIRYIPSGGSVDISITQEAQNVMIAISDDGPGIPKQERSRIFDRFYRILGTETTGTGLGLSIVKNIADIHHGTLSIAEGINGKGTSLQFTLQV